MEQEAIYIIAGLTSSVLFASSKLPMLLKAYRTRDLKSYSFGHIMLSNTGNAIYWLYVTSLPLGPIWLLQGFFTMADMLLLLCYVRYQRVEAPSRTGNAGPGNGRAIGQTIPIEANDLSFD
jgi:uncharacterized protein with PQ loop repeat